jgi:hypothetical protein
VRATLLSGHKGRTTLRPGVGPTGTRRSSPPRAERIMPILKQAGLHVGSRSCGFRRSVGRQGIGTILRVSPLPDGRR